MSEIIKEFGEWLLSVVEHYDVIIASGVVALLIDIADHYWEWKMPKKWYLRFVGVGLLLAVFSSWRTEKMKIQSESPELKVLISQVMANYNTAGFTMVLVEMGILNKGADSSVTHYKAHYHSPTFDGDVPVVWMTPQAEAAAFPSEYQTDEHDVGQIRAKAVAGIARGTIASGKLFVQLPGNRSHELMQKQGALTITVQDYLGSESSGGFPNTDEAVQILPFHTPE